MPLKRALSKERKKTMIKSNELREKRLDKIYDVIWKKHTRYLGGANEKWHIFLTQELALTFEDLYKQEIEGLIKEMMPSPEEVNFEEDNEAGIKREVLLDLLASLKQNK